MWSNELLGQIGRLTAPQGTLASFTAAGDVRRGLEASGFEVMRKPGFGRKREMITARHPKGGQGASTQLLGSALPKEILAPSRPAPVIAVVGAGVAGMAVAAALKRRGAVAVVLDSAKEAGAGASGNRVALQGPRLSVDHNAASRLSAACLSYGVRQSDEAAASIANGVMALDIPERMAERHDVLRTQQWPSSLVAPHDSCPSSSWRWN